MLIPSSSIPTYLRISGLHMNDHRRYSSGEGRVKGAPRSLIPFRRNDAEVGGGRTRFYRAIICQRRRVAIEFVQFRWFNVGKEISL